MRVFVLLGLAFLLSFVASGQTTELNLAAIYGKSGNDTFTVKPGVKLKAAYGSDRQACVLTVSGPVSEQEFMNILDATIPAQARGARKTDMVECVGGCLRTLDFENVKVVLGAIGASQISEPAGLITFKRKDCEAAAKEAQSTPFSLRTRR